VEPLAEVDVDLEILVDVDTLLVDVVEGAMVGASVVAAFVVAGVGAGFGAGLGVGVGAGFGLARRLSPPNEAEVEGGNTVMSDGPTLADMREAAKGEQEQRMQDNFIQPRGSGVTGNGPNDILF